jgi:hypothetical protein
MAANQVPNLISRSTPAVSRDPHQPQKPEINIRLIVAPNAIHFVIYCSTLSFHRIFQKNPISLIAKPF